MAVQRVTVLSVGVRGPGTFSFPGVTVPTGITAITVGMSRAAFGGFDGTVSWNAELSLDGGATWLPHGGATTVGGDVVDPETLAVATESFFRVALPESDNPARRLRGQVTYSALVTADLTVDFFDDPVVVPPDLPEHHSVLYDSNSQAAQVDSATVTSLTTPLLVVGALANRALLLGLSMKANNATSITGSFHAVSGSLISGTDSGTTVSRRTLQFGITAPPNVNDTVTMSWTTAMNAMLGVVLASGVDQTTPFNNGTFATGTSTTASVTITSAAGDLTADTVYAANGSLTAPTHHQVWNRPLSGETGAGSNGDGTGINTHSWTLGASVVWASSGANFNAFVAAPPPVLMGQALL